MNMKSYQYSELCDLMILHPWKTSTSNIKAWTRCFLYSHVPVKGTKLQTNLCMLLWGLSGVLLVHINSCLIYLYLSFVSLTSNKHVTCSSSLFCLSKACSASQLDVVDPVPNPVPLAQYCCDFSLDVVGAWVVDVGTCMALKMVYAYRWTKKQSVT